MIEIVYKRNVCSHSPIARDISHEDYLFLQFFRVNGMSFWRYLERIQSYAHNIYFWICKQFAQSAECEKVYSLSFAFFSNLENSSRILKHDYDYFWKMQKLVKKRIQRVLKNECTAINILQKQLPTIGVLATTEILRRLSIQILELRATCLRLHQQMISNAFWIKSVKMLKRNRIDAKR